ECVGRSIGPVRAMPTGGRLKSVCGIGISGVAVMFMTGFHFGDGRYRSGIIAVRYGWCAGTPANHAFRRGSLATRRAQPSYQMRCAEAGSISRRVMPDVCGGDSVGFSDCVMRFACVMGRFGGSQVTPQKHVLLRRGKRWRSLKISVRVAGIIR